MWRQRSIVKCQPEPSCGRVNWGCIALYCIGVVVIQANILQETAFKPKKGTNNMTLTRPMQTKPYRIAPAHSRGLGYPPKSANEKVRYSIFGGGPQTHVDRNREETSEYDILYSTRVLVVMPGFMLTIGIVYIH